LKGSTSNKSQEIADTRHMYALPLYQLW